MEPKLLLLDEVTSALDPELTGEVLRVIEGLARERMTMILVTHEMGFARTVADQIVFAGSLGSAMTAPGSGSTCEPAPSRNPLRRRGLSRKWLTFFLKNSGPSRRSGVPTDADPHPARSRAAAG